MGNRAPPPLRTIPLREWYGQLNLRWSELSLARQFAIASFLTLALGMISTAAWVSNRIEKGVVSHSALSAALFMDSFIAPLLQGMDTSSNLLPSDREVLSRLIENTPLGEKVLSFKIWGRNGIVVHSGNSELIGKVFPETESLKKAWSGTVQAEFDKLHDEEDAHERTFNTPLLEIYSPIRNYAGEIIAVSEFYTDAEQLERDLFNASLQSWLLFGSAGLAMFLALSGIALRGSRTIESQQAVMKKRVIELSDLRKRLQKASRRSTELNESFLRRIGSDLHDGPAQLIAFALLKLDEPTSAGATTNHNLKIRESLQDALTEIRGLSVGLILPGFEGMSLKEIIEQAAGSHQRRTGVKIDKKIDVLLDSLEVPQSILICTYRFVQETLNNAFLHGNINEASLDAQIQNSIFTIVVSDNGTGFDQNQIESDSSGLGLPGLRERINSVGGSFQIDSQPDNGAVIRASFSIEPHHEELNNEYEYFS